MLAVSTRGHRAALSHGRQIEIAFAVRTGACRRDQRVGIDRRRPDRVRRAGIGFEDRAIAKPKSGGGRIGLTGGGLIVGPPPPPFPSDGMTAASVEPFIGRRVTPVGGDRKNRGAGTSGGGRER